jgi:uncharacterized protein YndB with AHSA1/START domain/DNA-binding transcriptional ArsR family regulator
MQEFACIRSGVGSNPDDELDPVFRALADLTRRKLLDRLYERNGQTLSELCAAVTMTRQSASQHLAILEAANLISTLWRGRSKLHYLNPVPLEEIRERWMGKFEPQRLALLAAVKRRAEQRQAEEIMTDQPEFVYVIYIRATPARVWEALTDPELSGQYWGHRNVSDWQPGSRWEHQRTDGSGQSDVVGLVLESSPPTRLVTTWSEPGSDAGADAVGEANRVTFDIEPYGDIVRLTVTSQNFVDEADRAENAAGWPAVLSNLKSLLETGAVLPSVPWEMPH